METQVLTSNGTVQSGNVSAEYMATHDLSENKHSFVSYIEGRQTGRVYELLGRKTSDLVAF